MATGVTAGLARRLDDVLRGRADAFRQQSTTTCGSSTIAMFRVLTDQPFADDLLDGDVDEVSERWAVLERSVQSSTNRALSTTAGTRLRLPWPIALGTPPWGLRDALDDLGRARGVRFQVLRVDGADPDDVGTALGRVRATVARGIPVPLYVGNRCSRGTWCSPSPRVDGAGSAAGTDGRRATARADQRLGPAASAREASVGAASVRSAPSASPRPWRPGRSAAGADDLRSSRRSDAPGRGRRLDRVERAVAVRVTRGSGSAGRGAGSSALRPA